MTDADRHHSSASSGQRPPVSANSPAVAIFTVVLLAGLGAAGAVYGLSDLLGLGVAALIAVAGAFVATMAAGKPTTTPDAKANALLEAVSADDAPAEPPSRFRSEPWGSLYRRAAGYTEAQRTATVAVQEVEQLRRQLEGKPGVVAAEKAGVGAVEDVANVTDAASRVADMAETTRFVPSPTHRDEDLVGAQAAERTEKAVARALSESLDPIREELGSLERELEPIVRALRASGSTPPASRQTSPAKMVDTLVQTAADGIEDLAAGLMRANELASVAERVTNRATLLALNAALEATRSGSEAFASIAEETRRLAEYAREATDTISRLSSEIEMKVGETMSAIQTTSEDAKAAVATLGAGGSDPASRAVDPEAVAVLEQVLVRLRTVRGKAAAAASSVASAAPVGGASYGGMSGDSESHAEVIVNVSSESGASEASESGDSAPSGYGYGDVRIDRPSSAADASDSDEPGVDSGLAPAPSPAGDPVEDSGVTGDAPLTPPSLTPVVPKIPDWLEGLEPPDRR